MKIKIQNTNEDITIKEIWSHNDAKESIINDLAEVKTNLFEVMEKFFDAFPRFKEIVLNTELTENGKDGN